MSTVLSMCRPLGGQLVSLLCLLSLLSGCSHSPSADYSKVDLVSVSGTIRFDGDPLALAVVSFDDPELGTFSYAMTDTNGHYELQFDSVKKGVTPGEKIVQVSTTRRILGLNSSDEGGSEESVKESDGVSVRATELIPDCYRGKSRLKVTVTTDSDVFNFDLKSDCSVTGAS